MKPASTGRLIPVTPLAASDNSQAMACATSIGSTSRFIAAFLASRSLFSAPEAMPASSAAVRVNPGDTALTRTPDTSPFGRKRLRDLDDAGLCRGIGVDRSRRHAGDGGDIDDRAMLAARHPFADAARHQERATQIDVDLAVPIVHAHFFDRMHLAENAGGIDEAGDRAIRVLDRRQHRSATAASLATSNGSVQRIACDPASCSGRISTTTTLHPCSASSMAVAAPMPRLPPVTRIMPSGFIASPARRATRA